MNYLDFPSPKTTNKRDFHIQRVFEILPGALLWLTFIGGIAASFYEPVWMAVFIIIYDLFWTILALYMAIHLIAGYFEFKKNLLIDWLLEAKKIRGWDNIYHLIILPTYKEGLEILEPSLQALADSNYPKDKLIVVLTFEERAGEKLNNERLEILKSKFGDSFFIFITTIHPDGMEGEAKVKGANITWAAKKAKEFVDGRKIKYENVIVSAFDCDSRPHPQYFAALTCAYLKNPNPTRSSYQPLAMFFNNIWETTPVSRVIIIGSAFWNMIQAEGPERIVTFTSHSMSFKTLVDVNYWPVDMVSDDSIIFWKCYICLDGDYDVKPIFLPVYMDAVEAETAWQTVINQYKQYRRWAYGAENVPIIFRGFLANKMIPLKEKIIRFFSEIYGRHSWATSAIIVAFFGQLPLIFGGEDFKLSVVAFNLPGILQALMSVSMIGLFVSAFLSVLILPPHPKFKGKLSFILSVFEWLLLPIVAIPMGTLPAIDAQTRLMLGKYMEFWVTPKIRKK
jgi:cellulose synthase/poly-beta-1,6-N-acetylglucosamine synthase-like glycosyltransferase